MTENYDLIRKMNEIDYTMKRVLNRLPEEETLEDMITRIIRDELAKQSK
jgi:hypothetical protein